MVTDCLRQRVVDKWGRGAWAGAAVMVAVALPLLIWPAVAAGGTSYYVSPAGDDSQAGTSAEASLKTIGKAASLVKAGDAINVAPGVYAERVAPAASGTAEAAITIRKTPGAEGEVVWTSPPGTPKIWDDNYVLNLKGRQWWVVEGLTFRDCGAWIFLWEAHHNTVRDCVFDGAAIYNCLRVSHGSYNRILRCDFRRARAYEADAGGVAKGQADYIEIFHDSHHNLVEDCRFAEIGHVAVAVSGYSGTTVARWNIVRQCTFDAPRWKCFGASASEYTLLENCTMTGRAALFMQIEASKTIVRRNTFTGYVSNGRGEATMRGVLRLASTYNSDKRGESCPAHDNRFYHNLFTGNERTIATYAMQNTIERNVFKNNIFFNNGQTAWFCQWPTVKESDAAFVGNVLMGRAAGEKLLGYYKEAYTLKEAQAARPDLVHDNLEADPKLADAAKGDWRLAEGSPCIDAAQPLSRTTAAGQGKVVPVDDPLYFCDGWELIEPDRVVVGTNAVAKVVKVDYEKKTLTLEREIAWQAGQAVNLEYAGKGPDIGPLERGAEAVLGRRTASKK